MPETEGNELSVDELKDVSGGLKGGGGSLRRNSLQPEYSERLDAGGLGCNAGEKGGRLKKGQIKDGIADRYACNDNLPG